MRIAIAIFSTLIVTFCYLDISFALPTNTKTQADIRASLITKDNVAQYLEAQRQKKALENPILPEPFVVTTSLNIREKNSPNTRNSRTWFDKEDGAIVIEGQRYEIFLVDAIYFRFYIQFKLVSSKKFNYSQLCNFYKQIFS